jgi:pimeloyl-ACP methyl ester carboxylesterase
MNLCVLSLACTLVANASAASGTFAGLVSIDGGRKLYVQCRGAGSPTVILEAGLQVRSDYWSENTVKPPAMSVFPGVARFTHVCTYDRPGTVIGLRLQDRSRSDPVAMPRSATSIVDDLHALVRAAHIPAPFVLAGHSTGGLIVRLYALSFPREVAGLVLVDALPDGLQRDLTRAQYATFLRFNATPKALRSYKDFENVPFDPAFTELRRLQSTRPLHPMPLIVLTRGRPVVLPSSAPPGFSQALEKAWRIEQDRLVNLEPGARQIVAPRSDHYIMFAQPDLVIAAIRDVVDAYRAERNETRE